MLKSPVSIKIKLSSKQLKHKYSSSSAQLNSFGVNLAQITAAMIQRLGRNDRFRDNSEEEVKHYFCGVGFFFLPLSLFFFFLLKSTIQITPPYTVIFP